MGAPLLVVLMQPPSSTTPLASRLTQALLSTTSLMSLVGETTTLKASTGLYATLGESTGARWATSVSNSEPFTSRTNVPGPLLPTTLRLKSTTRCTATRVARTAKQLHQPNLKAKFAF